MPQQRRDYSVLMKPTGIVLHTESGDSFVWDKSHPKFDEVKQAIRDGQKAADIIKLADQVAAIKEVFADNGNVRVTREGVYYKDELIRMSLTERMVEQAQEGFDVQPMIYFLERLLQNPYRSSVLSLYDFLERNDIPVTPDGCFMCYKTVREDYMDQHSGTFDNHPGKTCEMPSWKVDADRDNGCSSGLHVCGARYLSGRGNGHIVMCKVNPAHVVAVPRDCDFAKMRVYKYDVVGELTDEQFANKVAQARMMTPGTPTEHVAWHEKAEDDDLCEFCAQPEDECECDGS